MRVIAGKFKGRILQMPKAVSIRPSSQKVKAALFNILGEEIRGASFLELFAGSGSIGIEALSRGANKVVFVENNRLCLKTIAQNLTWLKIFYTGRLNSQGQKKGQMAVLLPFDAEGAVRMLNQQGEQFDFVFLDPPYSQGKLKNSLIKISHYAILEPRSLLIAEHHQKQILPHLLGELRLVLTKTYGDTALSFYQVRSKL